VLRRTYLLNAVGRRNAEGACEAHIIRHHRAASAAWTKALPAISTEIEARGLLGATTRLGAKIGTRSFGTQLVSARISVMVR
jgi:hypothetical protein